ncbi:type IV pilin protein [Sphaerotilus sp.]|uniref:type IV pilin protein n=1 Tax=Sphaerotilus sp. TaxID=2093942 RepID=UPI002ACD684C|nr:type IV pilin protein [Sphaerotilus sp.]MDZ7858186.1 type IV pilin protein [Sphaerotilus sp.]
MTHRSVRGFTLVELVIAVAVVAILASVAVPSYREHVASSRRTDAKTALLAAAQAMERHYTERGTYVGATLGATGLYPSSSPQGYYALTIVSQDADGFSLLATRSGAQVGDKCGNYTYNQAGAKGVASASTGYTVAKCW